MKDITVVSYTYLIGWSRLHKFYYGVKYAKGCKFEDLMKTYFTSSDFVKKFICENGLPDIIQIRKVFDDPMKAIKWEEKVLHRMKVTKDNKWLNQNVSGGICLKDKSLYKIIGEKVKQAHKDGKYPSPWCKGLSKETDTRIRNMSDKLRGQKRTEETKRKIKERIITEEWRANLKKPKTEAHKKSLSKVVTKYFENHENREKISKIKKQYFKNPENIKKLSETIKKAWKDNPGLKDKIFTKECRKKLSENKKEFFKNPEKRKQLSDRMKEKVICEYCGIERNVSNITTHKRKFCTRNIMSKNYKPASIFLESA